MKTGIIDKQHMSKAYYMAIFGRTSVPPGAESLLLVGRSTVGNEAFTDTTGYTRRVLFDQDFTADGSSGLTLTAEHPFAPGPDLPFHRITTKDHAWLRTTATLWVDSAHVTAPLIVMTFHHDGRTYAYRTSTWTIPHGATGRVTATMDYLTPEVRSMEDNLKVYIWTQDGSTHRIGSLRVECYDRTD